MKDFDFSAKTTKELEERLDYLFNVAVEENKNEVCPITVSIGVGMFSGTNYKKAILEADKAMYDAKQKGRNQVVMWELQ